MSSTRIISSLALLVAASTADAATLIDIQGEHNEVTQIMTDGKKARMDTGNDGSYMIIDYAKKAVYAVLPSEKQVLDLGSDMPKLGGSPAQRVQLDLAPAGNGPKIAGYATKKFKLRANGQYCGEMYGSTEAMEATGIAQLFEAMKTMVDKQREAMGGYAAMIDPCTRASMQFESVADRIGVPMKMLDRNGKPVSEIKRIDTSASLPANAFAIPADYQVVTISEKVQQAVQPLQQQMPQIQQMLEQMQQQGGLPPEAMEQLQQFQQMMQQQ